MRDNAADGTGQSGAVQLSEAGGALLDEGGRQQRMFCLNDAE
jgi:hypothetical protein